MDLMIASLPSSGSDWFSECVYESGYFRRHPTAKEYFNPICNIELYERLASCLGCETVDTYRNLVRECGENDADLSRVYETTWQKESYNFTKEVWLPFKLAFFASRFRVVFLFRNTDCIFPPRRVRVLSWYNCLYCAIAEDKPGALPVVHDVYSRAVAAQMFTSSFALASCTALGVSVIEWEDLVSSPPEQCREILCNAFGSIPEVDVDVLTRKVLRTRTNDVSERRCRYLSSVPPIIRIV